MTEYEGDVLTSGPGSPSVSIRKPAPEDEFVIDAEFEDLDDAEPGDAELVRPNRLRSLFVAIVAPESLAITGTFLVFFAVMGRSLLIQLATMATGLAKQADGDFAGGRTEVLTKLAVTYNALTSGVAMTAVIAGASALLLADRETPRWVRGLGGAAVLVGLLLAAGHLLASRGQASIYSIFG